MMEKMETKRRPCFPAWGMHLLYCFSNACHFFCFHDCIFSEEDLDLLYQYAMTIPSVTLISKETNCLAHSMNMRAPLLWSDEAHSFLPYLKRQKRLMRSSLGLWLFSGNFLCGHTNRILASSTSRNWLSIMCSVSCSKSSIVMGKEERLVELP